jgi:hypothetical protein
MDFHKLLPKHLAACPLIGGDRPNRPNDAGPIEYLVIAANVAATCRRRYSGADCLSTSKGGHGGPVNASGEGAADAAFHASMIGRTCSGTPMGVRFERVI